MRWIVRRLAFPSRTRRSPRFGAKALLAVSWAVILCVRATAPVLAQGEHDLIGEVTLFGEEEFKIQAATKTEIPISKAPGSVTVISAQQIRESQARTIPEILRLVAGVNVRWNPMVQTVDIRSFGQNPFTSRVLLLIDGVPYNSWNKGGFPQHPGFDFFNLRNVKRIEVVRGPGSSLYGENAYWGVINIVTLSGEDLEGGRVEVYGGDLETQALSAMYGTKLGERGSFLASAKVANGQFPTSFWFDENNSQVELSDVFLKAKAGGLELSYYRFQDSVDGFTDSFAIPVFPQPQVFQSVPKVEQTVEISALKYSKRWDNGFSFAGDLSYAKRSGAHCASCHASTQQSDFSDVHFNHGFQLIGDFRVGVHDLPHNDLLLGVELRKVDAGAPDDELLGSGGGNGVVTEYSKVAAYVQDIISVADDKLDLVLGARYDGSTELFDDEISPRLAIVYTPTQRAVVRAGYSTAFRFPNFTELYQSSAFLFLQTPAFSVPLSVFQPNPDLKREEIRSYELGFEYRLTKSLSAKLDLYHSEVRDFIVIANGSPPPPARPFIHFENHPDDATIEGGELELRFTAGRKATGFIGWAYEDPEQKGQLVDSAGRPIEFVYASKNKFTFGAYLGPFAGFRFSLESQWRDDFTGPSYWNNILNRDPSPYPLEGYGLINARLSYDLPVRIGDVSEAVRLSVYGKNLSDEEPIETIVGVGSRLAGRQFFGSVEVRF